MSTTIVAATPGYRVLRVQFADLHGPAVVDLAPIVAWVTHETGTVVPITLPVDGIDALSADCAIEGPDFPGVVAHGTRFATQTLWVESRRDALRAQIKATLKAGLEQFGPPPPRRLVPDDEFGPAGSRSGVQSS